MAKTCDILLQHVVEWVFRLLIVVYIGMIFGFFGEDPDGGCSYGDVNPAVIHGTSPVTRATSANCRTISSPYACMVEEYRFRALAVAENTRHPFSGTGTCVVDTDGHFDFKQTNASDPNQVCGFNVDGVVPHACEHWENSMYGQVRMCTLSCMNIPLTNVFTGY